MKELFSIGEFSKASGLTVKAIRFYHEQEILIPRYVDDQSGYRYFDSDQLELAEIILRLKELNFSVKQIAEIVRICDDQSQMVDKLESKLDEVTASMEKLENVRSRLESMIQSERATQHILEKTDWEIATKSIEELLIAGIRMTGRYQDCGPAFGRISRFYGRRVNGAAMMLCYDNEYKEDDADFEPCLPISTGESKKGVDVRTLPAGECLSLFHTGPYSTLKYAYQQLLQHAKERDLTLSIPSREIYHKGPGMIFKGNPDKYVTEIQLFVNDRPS